MHIGQPGMHRPHRHLDGKGGKEGKEDGRLCGLAKRQCMPSGNIKTAVGGDVEVNQRDQGQQRTEQGVKEKLESRVNFVRPAPDTDDEVHGYQRGFEKHVEQKAVQGAKHANHQAR